MAYSVQADIVKVRATAILAELTNGTAGAINTTVLSEAIEWADTQINLACDAAYGPMPFSPVPIVVKHWSVDLTLFRLASMHGLGMDLNIALAGEEVRKQLHRIADGKGSIPGLAPSRKFVRRAPDAAVAVFSIQRVDSAGKEIEAGTLDKF